MTTSKKQASSVVDYLETLSEIQRKHLQQLREILLQSFPGLEEGLTYGTPAYRANGKLVVGIASAKTHTGLYVMSEEVTSSFKNELTLYEVAKTSIKFSFDTRLPAAVIRKIVLARIAENEAKSPKKK